jgi:hypothetical protein
MTTEHKPWTGVDLDGTLAKYDGWEGPEHIGEPVPLMALRVIDMLKRGIEVRILTARVCSIQPPGVADAAREAIGQWCEKHIGQRLKVTAEKDYMMELLFDDRAVPVEFNTGRIGT